MAYFTPTPEGFDAALDDPAAVREYRVQIDPDGDPVDITHLLDNNSISIRARRGSGGQADVTLRNSTSWCVEGAYAGEPIGIDARVDASDWIEVFRGWVDDKGAKLDIGVGKVARARLQAHTIEKRAGTRQKPAGTVLTDWTVCDPAAPASSIVHKLAELLGLGEGDLDVGTIDYTIAWVELGGRSPWQELQELAELYRATLYMTADGKLRIRSTLFEDDPPVLAAEWEFANDDDFAPNIRDLRRAVSGEYVPINCNRGTCEFDEYVSLGVGEVVWLSIENYNIVTNRISIEIAPGAYWPTADNAASVAELRYKHPTTGEEIPYATDVVEPTIGEPGSGSDIESDDGLPTLVSFNGSTGATEASPTHSEIILLNDTAEAITLTRFQIRGTGYRINAKHKVIYEEPDIADELRVDATLPGTYAADEQQVHDALQALVEDGKGGRRKRSFVTQWLPQVQLDALVNVRMPGEAYSSYTVIGYDHPAPGGPMTKAETVIEVEEVAEFVPSGTPDPRVVVMGESQPGPSTDPPAEVTGVSYRVIPGVGIYITWDRLADPNVRYYIVKVGDDWDTGETIAETDSTYYLWETHETDDFTIMVRAMSYGGRESLSDGTEEAEYAAEPDTVGSLTATAYPRRIVIEWPAVGGLAGPYVYDLEKSTNGGVDYSELSYGLTVLEYEDDIGEVEYATLADVRYRVKGRDRYGNESSEWTATAATPTRDDSYGTWIAATVTSVEVHAAGSGRSISVTVDRQGLGTPEDLTDDLIEEDGLLVQISIDDGDWFEPNFEATGSTDAGRWYTGDEDDYATLSAFAFSLRNLPLTNESDDELAVSSEVYYLRFKRFRKDGTASAAWSDSVSVVCTATSARDLVENAVKALHLDPDALSAANQSLVAVWSMDEDDTGNGVADIVGGYDLTEAGPPTVGTGISDHCRVFNGSSQYLTRAAFFAPGVADFAIVVWFKSSYSGGTVQALVAQRDNAYTSGGIGFHLRISGTGRIMAGCGDGTNYASDSQISDGATDWRDGLWHQVVALFDRDYGMYCYIDGHKQSALIDLSAVGNITAASNFRIGANPYSNIHYMNGSIDEVRLYSSILEESEVKWLYQIPDGVYGSLIDGVRVKRGTITAEKIYVVSLAAIVANLGSITDGGGLTPDDYALNYWMLDDSIDSGGGHGPGGRDLIAGDWRVGTASNYVLFDADAGTLEIRVTSFKIESLLTKALGSLQIVTDSGAEGIDIDEDWEVEGYKPLLVYTEGNAAARVAVLENVRQINLRINGADVVQVTATAVTVDAAGDIILDADGANIILKDNGTTFGSLSQVGGQLVIKSGSTPTTALTFAGANASFAGLLGVATATPRRAVDILATTDPQLRLTYSDNVKYVDFQTDANGYLTITAVGTDITLTSGTGSTQIDITSVGAGYAALSLKPTTTGIASISVGEGRSGSGYSHVSLVGDATYTDYGLRVIRGNAGANATSQILHRGTGTLSVITDEAAAIAFETDSTARMTIGATGNIALGDVTPDSLVHIHLGTAGAVTAYAGTVLTVENSGSAYISLLTPAANESGILFGDPDDNDVGWIVYDHATNDLLVRAGAATVLQWDNSADRWMSSKHVSAMRMLPHVFIDIGSPTEDTVFDELSPYVPNVGDILAIHGHISFGALGAQHVVWAVERYDANTLEFWGTKVSGTVGLSGVVCVNGSSDTFGEVYLYW